MIGTYDNTHVDQDRLAAWMDSSGIGEGPLTDVVRLAGGTQNVLISFRRNGEQYVLRRPPPNPRPESNETMRREGRVLAALKGTDVPHPRLIAMCGDETVLGVAFYLMEAVDGFSATRGLPKLHAESPEIRRQMGFSLVEGAATLARVDYLKVGLEGFGRPENYLSRQVARWRSQLDRYSQHVGWPGASGLPGITEVAAYLEANQPKSFVPGIMHGDYSIGNVMFRFDGPKLAAIIDWELATIGDPLIDLGWILATWREPEDVGFDVFKVEPFDGFPTSAELVEHYALCSDRDLRELTWYVVLACYKLAIILEGTYARACAGSDPMDIGLNLHDTAVKLFGRALGRINNS